MDADRTMPRIKILPDGPYLVTGAVPVSRRSIIRSEHGESMTWQTTARIETGDTVALCRCGGSANKPFCDGTHAKVRFDGNETAPTDTYDDRATNYHTDQVEVRDDRGICEHAGFCSNRLTNVWEMVAGAAAEDSVVRSQMMSMVEHCPSGALTYRVGPGGEDIEPELATAIGVTDDGPYYVTGGIPIERSDGEPFESRNRVTLCRCGASSNKPLCDGSHQDAGFADS